MKSDAHHAGTFRFVIIINIVKVYLYNFELREPKPKVNKPFVNNKKSPSPVLIEIHPEEGIFIPDSTVLPVEMDEEFLRLIKKNEEDWYNGYFF